jgi:hypothetical protein
MKKPFCSLSASFKSYYARLFFPLSEVFELEVAPSPYFSSLDLLSLLILDNIGLSMTGSAFNGTLNLWFEYS